MATIEKNVPARPHGGYWTNTGISVTNGSKVKVSYISGSWRTNPHWSVADAAGNAAQRAPATYLMPGEPEGALVAEIGGGVGWGG